MKHQRNTIERKMILSILKRYRKLQKNNSTLIEVSVERSVLLNTYRLLKNILLEKYKQDEYHQSLKDELCLIMRNPENIFTEEFEYKLNFLTHLLGIDDHSIMRFNHQCFLIRRRKEIEARKNRVIP